MVDLDEILSEYFLKRSDGGLNFNIKNNEDLFSFIDFLNENKYDDFFDKKKLINLNELKIKNEVGTDGILTVKSEFVNKVFGLLEKTKDEELRNKLKGNLEQIKSSDKIYRLPEKPSTSFYIRVNSSSVELDDSLDVSDTFWEIKSVPDITFVIKMGVEMNSLLKRLSSISKKILNTDTESIHECFFVVALADIDEFAGESSRLKDINDVNSLIDLTKKLSKIKDAALMEDIFRASIGEGEISDEINLRKYDAIKCAQSVYNYVLKKYNIETFEYVRRMFHSQGKKSLADVLLTIKISGETESFYDIIISLKYKKGQLANLGSKKIFELLYGIEMKNKGIMSEIYNMDDQAKRDIDDLIRFFISGINQILPPKDESNRLSNNITYYQYVKSKNNYYSIVYKDISDNDTEVYGIDGSFKFLENFKILKKEKLTSNISRYISEKMTDKTDFYNYIVYTLRCHDTKSYLYVSDSGKSIYNIPSKEFFKNKKLEIKIETKNAVDFTSKIIVIVDDLPIFEFEMSFRWTKLQFQGNLSPTTKNLKILNEYE